MATNLSIENLSRMVELGDTQGLLEGNGTVSESKVTQEMQKVGLEPNADWRSLSAPGAAEPGKGFGDVLKASMEKVNNFQKEADTAVKELVAGRNKNIHETMLIVERADTSLKLMMQVRNKVLDAYKEIMRMQV